MKLMLCMHHAQAKEHIRRHGSVVAAFIPNEDLFAYRCGAEGGGGGAARASAQKVAATLAA